MFSCGHLLVRDLRHLRALVAAQNQRPHLAHSICKQHGGLVLVRHAVAAEGAATEPEEHDDYLGVAERDEIRGGCRLEGRRGLASRGRGRHAEAPHWALRSSRCHRSSCHGFIYRSTGGLLEGTSRLAFSSWRHLHGLHASCNRPEHIEAMNMYTNRPMRPRLSLDPSRIHASALYASAVSLLKDRSTISISFSFDFNRRVLSYRAF